ncbi:Arf/Sar family, other [Strigomonas culicis]|nr:Arf/Sar family, other [Strigomonas culicis]|eukprot:EPY33642.1 Arf/Sar family, other [Strigomonas culicis]
MGGAKKFRSLWESHYSTVQGIVFVIDSSDVLRLCVVKDELEALLQHPDLNADAGRKRVPVLVYANKNDLEGAKTPAELTELLDLPELMGDRPYNIFSSDARKGVALAEGMGWLQETVLLQLGDQKKKGK